MALRQQPYYRGKNDYKKYKEERVGSIYKKDPLTEANQNIQQENGFSSKLASYRNQTSSLKYDNYSQQLENKFSYRNGDKQYDFNENFDIIKERPNKYSRQTSESTLLTSTRNQKPFQSQKTSKFNHQQMFSQRSKFISTGPDNNFKDTQNFEQKILNRQSYNDRLSDKCTFQKSTQYPANQRIRQEFSTFVKNRNPLSFQNQNRNISPKIVKQKNFTFMDQNKYTLQPKRFKNQEPQQITSTRYQNRNDAIIKNLTSNQSQKNYENQQQIMRNRQPPYISERKQNNYMTSDKPQNQNQVNNNNKEHLYNRYNSTSQNTPTKLTNGIFDRGSEQRRKSLIEKSQILKQKLNKLNSSNLKQQQTDRQMPESRQFKNVQSENKVDRYQKSKDIFNPTPQKSSYQKYQSSRSPYSAVSKKLQYDVPVSSYQRPSLFMGANSYEVSQGNGTMNLTDPIKKISQLNDKINERIQSIMRNYGN